MPGHRLHVRLHADVLTDGPVSGARGSFVSALRRFRKANDLGRAGIDATILRHIEKHQGAIATSSVTWHEMLFGAQNSMSVRKRELIEAYLREVVGPTVPIYSYDTPAAGVHAIERARLSLLGKTPPFADGQIAAIARVNGLVLVTRNVSDFRKFEGLEVENWGRT